MIPKLKETRLERKISQKEIAKKINLTQQTYSDYETGRTNPDIETLIKIANILECSVDYLIGREDDFGNIVIKEKSPAPALTQAEQDLLDDFRSVPRPEQAQIAEYAHYVADKHAAHKQQSIKKNA